MNYDEIIIQQSLALKHIFISTFLFEGYTKRTLNYLKRIVLSYLTHMMSIDDYIFISVETFAKDFI